VGCAHEAEKCRVGADRHASVADARCEADEFDNLYVVDASVFPCLAAQNRALTAMANSLCVGTDSLREWARR